MSDPIPTLHVVHVAVHTPVHSGVGVPLSYTHSHPLPPGTLVRVPLGTRQLLGVVWPAPQDAAPPPEHAKLRAIEAVMQGLPALDTTWQRLVSFAARYYQRSVGEIAMAGLPPALRDMTAEQLAKRLQPPKPKKPSKKAAAATAAAAQQAVDNCLEPSQDHSESIALSAEQQSVFSQIIQNPGPFLLYGSTGSGKTEVYMRVVQQALEASPQAQALVMVPEINLTPQLQERFESRFMPMFGAQAVVSMHSGMTDVQRLKSWLAAHTGAARIVLGTRMSIFASLPGLKVIVVDEEHDPSYKQQEGARYSARDLALWRGHACQAQVILGSATPSLESWHASEPASSGGPARYLRLHMPSRIGAGALD